jgi:hemolysin III
VSWPAYCRQVYKSMEGHKNNIKNRMKAGHTGNMNEEIANSISHGIGAGLSVAALSILVVMASRHGDAWRVVSFSIYGSTLIILYLASTFYHLLTNSSAKRVFHIFDHSAIFLLIAGSYTPFCLVTIRGGWGWTIFGIVWGVAIFGIVFKAFFTGRFNIVSTILYLVMSWIAVIAIKPLLENLPATGFIWLGLGGACYMAGILFYAWKKLPFGHFIWHLFVLGGSIFHFFGILFYVLPM